MAGDEHQMAGDGHQKVGGMGIKWQVMGAAEKWAERATWHWPTRSGIRRISSSPSKLPSCC